VGFEELREKMFQNADLTAEAPVIRTCSMHNPYPLTPRRAVWLPGWGACLAVRRLISPTEWICRPWSPGWRNNRQPA
jgi:hypothetical protein